MNFNNMFLKCKCQTFKSSRALNPRSLLYASIKDFMLYRQVGQQERTGDKGGKPVFRGSGEIQISGFPGIWCSVYGTAS